MYHNNVDIIIFDEIEIVYEYIKIKNGAIVTNRVIRLWDVSCKINVVEKI